jgi:hypothetical protein
MIKQLDDLKLHGIKNRQKYLNDTDWVVIRALETSITEDQTIKDKRQLARDEISEIRDATDYESVQHLSEDF